ncbi:MAG: hypothetical protein ACK4Q5_06060 [Saprospiraceae bacterium]
MRKYRDPRAVYVTEPQRQLLESPAKKKTFVAGRGAGKTTGEGLQVYLFLHNLPRSKGFIVGLTYKQILNNFLPQMQDVWAVMGLREGLHYVVGIRPPAHWARPFKPPKEYENTVTFWNGTCIVLISMDRKDLARGGSYDWGLFDEAVLLNKERIDKEIMPMLRGNEHRFSHHLHQTVLFASSQSWLPSGNWVPDMATEVDPNDPTAVFYIESTARDNAAVGGEKYMTRMRKELPRLVYDVEVENVRVQAVPDCFYAALDPARHCYFDSFDYDFLPDRSLFTRNRDYKPDAPLAVSFDFGTSICTCTVHQVHGQEDRTINALFRKRDMDTTEPRPLLTALVEDFLAEYKTHKVIVEIWGDRNGNNAQMNSTSSLFEDIQAQMRAAGLLTQLMVPRGSLDPPHLLKHHVVNKLLSESDPKLPRVRINQNRCKALILSMQGAAVTMEGKKDKSSEDPRRNPSQEFATHLSDCFDNYYAKKYAHLFGDAGGGDIWF